MPWLTRGSNVHVGSDYQTNFPTFHHYRTTRYMDKWLAESSGHYGYPDFPDRKNVGGGFVLRGTETHHSPTENTTYWRGGTNNQHYRGFFVTDVSPYQQPNLSVAAMLGSNWAAEAYAKMKPTKPEFSDLNSLIELRELPGLLRQRFLDSGFNRVGSYHLALEFGYKPLLRDILNLAYKQRIAQERLKQLLRDNGRPVRRRIVLRDESVSGAPTSGTAYGCLQPVLVTQYYVRQPTWKQATYFRERIWASARFRYWLPGGPRDVAWTKKMLSRLYGREVSPSALYNAIPWSWLIDWFSNLGDLIENLDAGVADKLAADYFYIMRSQEWSMERVSTGRFRRQNGTQFDVTATAWTTAYAKSRVRGGPFDPAILTNQLSNSQLAILGALGLSRL
jgi:hypothetical protein